MRCPKCGYISFDHVDTCLNCNKDISKFLPELEGTTYNVRPPSFLKFQKREDRPQDESGSPFDAGDEYDVVDPDLDVLVEEDEDEEEGIAFGGGLDFGQMDEEEDIELGLDDDDDEDGIDLGQFEDAFAEEEPEERNPGEISLNLPDELADISDLSAPGEENPEKKASAAAAHDNFGDLSLDLDIDSLDDDEFSLTLNGEDDQNDDDGLDNLSLDDLGLSESEDDIPSPPKKEHGGRDMDADLDFDLDLGGISLDKDE